MIWEMDKTVLTLKNRNQGFCSQPLTMFNMMYSTHPSTILTKTSQKTELISIESAYKEWLGGKKNPKYLNM